MVVFFLGALAHLLMRILKLALCARGGDGACIFCGGGYINVVLVVVHGGFAAVTQPRIHLEERSL